MLFCVAIAVFMGVFFGLAAKNAPQSMAVKATDFNAGRIIDDSVFYNPDTMTVEEIQAHLDKYSADCDMWGEKAIGYGRKINGVAVNPNVTRREYARMMREAGRTDYHDAPYVCISKFYEDPTTHKTNFDTNAEPEEGMISAAQIIYDAAHQYNINPQVLLVMLKKESYVWGDTWPLKNEYNTVMGYACPDNAPCDSAYFGFYNQVMKAAWQLNYYKEHIYSYGYYPYMTNYIYYSPNYSCGRKAVYLENIATTSLYIYTPYTPNDAALANYPGEAYCGSYGNRNFFMYFSEWFGSTYSDHWHEITSPVVMTVTQDTITLRASDASLTDEWNYAGQHNMYTSKIEVVRDGNTEICLRKKSDEILNKNTCVLLSRLEEYNPQPSESDPKKYISKRYTCEIDLTKIDTDCEKSVEKSTQIVFDSIVEIDGVKYLTNTTDQKHGYLFERFMTEDDINYYESAKLAIAPSDIKSYSIDGSLSNISINANTGVLIIGELSIDDNKYYASMNESSVILLPFDKIDINNSSSPFLIPRYLIAKKDSQVIDLVTNEVCLDIEQDRAFYYTRKLSFGGVSYFQDNEHSDSSCFMRQDQTYETSDIFTNFVLPRRLKIKQDAHFVNVLDGSDCEIVEKSDIRYFDSKIDKDGTTYFRTKKDREATNICAVSSEFTEEL